jgi:hypothetical protein
MRIKLILFLILALVVGTSIKAQPASEKAHGISFLSQNHKVQRQSLYISQLKEIESIKKQMGQNKERFNYLMSFENPDMNEVYKNIDESGILRSQLLRSRLQLIKIFVKL